MVIEFRVVALASGAPYLIPLLLADGVRASMGCDSFLDGPEGHAPVTDEASATMLIRQSGRQNGDFCSWRLAHSRRSAMDRRVW
jgi:hypothetical protein